MKQTLFVIICLIFITFIASFLRLWHLGGIPVSPDWDEVAFGYNTYSLLKTGKDEYGAQYPLALQSFNDYKPAGFAYLDIPFVWFLGLTVTAIRLPSALIGILGVIGTFFLSYELLFYAAIYRNKREYISLLACFLLAISPWHIQFSRVAFEANIALTLCIYGLLFFLLGLKKPIFYILASVSYGLGMYFYHTEQIFIPLFVFGLCVLFYTRLKNQKKYLFLPLIILCIALAPRIYLLFTGQLLARFASTNIFSQQNYRYPWEQIVGGIRGILDGYLSHFSLRWLFVIGDNDRHHAPSMGLLYLWELPFLLYGLSTTIRMKCRMRLILFLWIFLSPLAAAFTAEVPHAVRTLVILPSLQICTALGVWMVLEKIKELSPLIRRLVVVCIIVMICVSTVRYLHLYFFQMNHEASQFWQFGYEHVVNYVSTENNKNKKIIVSSKLEQPYIFFLFYTRYDPSTYLTEGGTTYSKKYQKFGRFEFRPITLEKEKHDGTGLYILAPIETSKPPLHIIRNFDSSEAFKIFE